ncbi:M43 family zinc metalloprotease [uncultured Hymenobacter sp.]|uniref:M43 family zinc metalloprotease n=1 Tax=uncultured Hymenobacter sp. TaxID=170016 RepID=UPI0035C9FC3B
MVKNIYAAALALTSATLLSISVQAQNFGTTRGLPTRPELPTTASGTPGRNCATTEVLNAQLAADPAQKLRMDAIEAQTRRAIAGGRTQTNFTASGAVITIPVVVHVLYNTAAQNISDAQVQSQIDVLNEDFRKLNADRSKTPAAFAGVAADIGIQFKLATVDPTGAPTNGIIHKYTKTASWSTNDAVKNSKRGGDNAWPAGQYLNMWACNLGQGLLGYAQFPGGAASTDGVVCLYSAFGSRAKFPAGTYTSTYDIGRTTTHEVGHWLNLRHIWGDASCGNDLVSDTPTQQTSNYGCPTYPHVTCANQGDMSMNYMDYTDDACMYMFSSGQSARMNALFASGGARASLLTSTAAGAARTSAPVASAVSIYPNPAASVLNLTNLSAPAQTSVRVYSLQGAEMRQARYDGRGHLQVQSLPRGLYYLDVTDASGHTSHQRFEKE